MKSYHFSMPIGVAVAVNVHAEAGLVDPVPRSTEAAEPLLDGEE
jgi:hypothetical protein